MLFQVFYYILHSYCYINLNHLQDSQQINIVNYTFLPVNEAFERAFHLTLIPRYDCLLS